MPYEEIGWKTPPPAELMPTAANTLEGPTAIWYICAKAIVDFTGETALHVVPFVEVAYIIAVPPPVNKPKPIATNLPVLFTATLVNRQVSTPDALVKVTGAFQVVPFEDVTIAGSGKPPKPPV